MLNLIKLATTIAAGAILGLAATYVMISPQPRIGALHAGAWTVWPRIGSNTIDPYARAAVARTGEVPLGLAEGLTFIARADDAGEPLYGKCAYRVAGPVPSARFWTLVVNTLDGYLVDNPAKRWAFTSREIIRDSSGGFRIFIGRAAHTGNWLPLGDVGQFQIALRLYDTTLSATASTLDRTLMPSIVREGCS